MNLADLIQEWCDQNKAYHFEGDTGLDRFGELLEAIGYKPHGFRHGSVIEAFLSDNSGAVQAIIEWIIEMDDPDWVANIESTLSEKELD